MLPAPFQVSPASAHIFAAEETSFTPSSVDVSASDGEMLKFSLEA
jgi:hypothetical protein